MSKDLLTECEVYTKVFARGFRTDRAMKERGRRERTEGKDFPAYYIPRNEVNKTFIIWLLVHFPLCL